MPMRMVRLAGATIGCAVALWGAVLQAQQATQPAELKRCGANPAVSPDGQWVAYNSECAGQADLYAIEVSSGRVIRLTNDTAKEGRPIWASDGARILYAARGTQLVHVAAVDLRGISTALGDVTASSLVSPVPDGRHVLFGTGDWSARQIGMMGIDGREQQMLTADSAAWSCAAVSRAGDRVAAARGFKGTQEIWVIDPGNRSAQPIARVKPSDGVPNCPGWSADGRRIAFQMDRWHPQDSARSFTSIFGVDIASGAIRQLVPNPMYAGDELPAWFPDGKRIAFQSNRSGRWEVWIADLERGTATQLTR
jgi:TolB protein